MPTFRLHGFPDGAPVAVSLVQGLASAAASVPSWRTPVPPSGDFPQLLHGAETAYEIHMVSEDSLGDLAFTVELDGSLLGPFQRSAAEQVSGVAVSHAIPVISETSNPGIYACSSGLWTYGLVEAPVPGYQWTRNGASIDGATGSTYSRVAADAGTNLRCGVTVGGVVATSSEIALPAASAMSVSLLGVRERDGVGAFADFTNPAPQAGQRLVVMVSGEPFGGSGAFQMTVNGGSAILPISQAVSAADNAMSIFETAAPAGSTITIASLVSGGTSGRNHCAAYLVTGGRLRSQGTSSAIQRATGSAGVALDAAAGGAVIAGSSATWYAGATLNVFTGVTEDGVLAAFGGEQLQVGSAVGLSATSVYNVSTTISPASQQVVLAAVSMEPV
jgi:hypothetical protein